MDYMFSILIGCGRGRVWRGENKKVMRLLLLTKILPQNEKNLIRRFFEHDHVFKDTLSSGIRKEGVSLVNLGMGAK